MKTELKQTRDYSIFQMHELNRPLHDNPVLLKSMQTHGFMPSSPIHCQPAGGGKLKIIRGHHRFHYAKRLGLPVWYVVDNTDCDIFELEGGPGCAWSVNDFAQGYAAAKHRDYVFLLGFKSKHSLTMGAAASLVGGQSAGSGNKLKDIKVGTFKVGDMKHANEVVAVTDLCRDQGVAFATATAFVRAVSMVLRVPEVDANVLCHKIRLLSANMRRRGRVDEYLDELDALWNYGAKAKRLPLKFRAIAVSRERKNNFGREPKATTATA